MSTEQLGIGPAALSNEEGARKAVEQIPGLNPDQWHLFYDRKEDTLFCRRRDHGPATTYFLPDQPEVHFRLDSHGQLVGIDLTDYRRVLAKQHRDFGLFLRGWYVSQAMAKIPGLRWVADTLASGLKERARDEVRDLTAACAT